MRVRLPRPSPVMPEHQQQRFMPLLIGEIERAFERLEASGDLGEGGGGGVADGQVYYTRGGAWNGGGSAIVQADAAEIQVHCKEAGTIKQVTVLGNPNGSCVIDVRRTTLAGLPATGANSICGGNKPGITANYYDVDTAMTSWNLNVNAGDVLTFVLESCTGFEQLAIYLAIEVTAGTAPKVLTQKGDLWTRDASSDYRLPAGSDGQVLTVDSTTDSGLKWAAGGGGGGAGNKIIGYASSLGYSTDFNYVDMARFLAIPANQLDKTGASYRFRFFGEVFNDTGAQDTVFFTLRFGNTGSTVNVLDGGFDMPNGTAYTVEVVLDVTRISGTSIFTHAAITARRLTSGSSTDMHAYGSMYQASNGGWAHTFGSTGECRMQLAFNNNALFGGQIYYGTLELLNNDTITTYS